MATLVEHAAVRLYRALLVCYPQAFRSAHGADAASLFGEACRDEWSRRTLSRLGRRILAAIVTVPLGGWAERRASRPDQGANTGQSLTVLGGPGLWTDMKHAFRSVSRRPAFAATVVGTLALGIGTNTAVFSVIDATALRPVPYVDARRAMILEAVLPSGQIDPNPNARWVDAWSAQMARAVERVEARNSRFVVLTGTGSATRKVLMEATPGYLSSIGTRPVLGRLLATADSLPGAPPVAVITRDLWRAQFGQRPDVLGTSITVDGVAHQIVGVAAALESDVPGLTFSLASALPEGSSEPVLAVAWLRPGISRRAAEATIASISPLVDKDGDIRPRLSEPYSLWHIPVFKVTELGMGAASLLLLVIAGVNVVNLLFAVGETRLGELAIRRALGANPRRLLRLLLIETGVLTLSGAAFGLGIAWAIVRALAALEAGEQLQTQLERIRLDPVVVGYLISLAVVMTLAVGVMPALRGARAPAANLKEGGSRSVSRPRRAAWILVAVETALSATLLVAAGVVGHSFLSMEFADRGFASEHVLRVNLELPTSRYPTRASQATFFNQLLSGVSRLPGVTRAGMGYCATVPFDCIQMGQWSAVGSTTGPVRITSARAFVTPGYFALMGIPLVQGADFTSADLLAQGASVRPAIVSRSLARQLWGEGNVVGAILQIGTSTHVTRYRIIGVSGDVSIWGLMMRNCRNCDLQLYEPLPETRNSTDVLLRMHDGAPFPEAALRATVAHLDPDIPSDDMQTAEESLRDFIHLPRFTAALFAGFGGLALALALVGLSAVVSHAVAQRTREMGIRVALGATAGSVRRLVIGQGLRPVITGLVLGLGAALVLTRYLRAVLYGMSPTDPITFVAVTVVLTAMAAMALSVPALRATRVDPVQALRAD